VFATLCLVLGGMYTSPGETNALAGCPSISASPRPFRMINSSSFFPVVCQPTDSLGFSRTNPLRIPAVCGLPSSRGQSFAAHPSGRVSGWGAGAWDERQCKTRENRSNAPKQTIAAIRFILESLPVRAWVATLSWRAIAILSSSSMLMRSGLRSRRGRLLAGMSSNLKCRALDDLGTGSVLPLRAPPEIEFLLRHARYARMLPRFHKSLAPRQVRCGVQVALILHLGHGTAVQDKLPGVYL
jgi:hypothetical protein